MEKKIQKFEECKLSVSIAEYRKLLNDTICTDEDIIKRIKYLEGFCGNIIKSELQKS